MANPNGANDQVIGNGNPDGATLGERTDSIVGFHGNKTPQVTISVSGLTNIIGELLTLLNNKGLINYTGGNLNFGDIELGLNTIGFDPDSGGLAFDEYDEATFTNAVNAGRYVSVTDSFGAPSAMVGKCLIYVDSADGDLKCKFGNGFVATLAVDS